MVNVMCYLDTERERKVRREGGEERVIWGRGVLHSWSFLELLFSGLCTNVSSTHSDTSMVYIHSEIYPYVVITIGLENILIIVKAVMSTPEELDVSVYYYLPLTLM